MPPVPPPVCTLLALTSDHELAKQVELEVCAGACRVAVAATPEEFRDAFRLLRPIVVLLDGSADEHASLGLLRELRVWHPSLPVIYVAGHHSLATELEARRGAVLHYTAKPPARGAVGRLVVAAARTAR